MPIHRRQRIAFRAKTCGGVAHAALTPAKLLDVGDQGCAFVVRLVNGRADHTRHLSQLCGSGGTLSTFHQH